MTKEEVSEELIAAVDPLHSDHLLATLSQQSYILETLEYPF